MDEKFSNYKTVDTFPSHCYILMQYFLMHFVKFQVWVDVKSEICQWLKTQDGFWSNPSEETLSNTNAELTTDFLDKTCSTALMEENGVVANPQFVPVSSVFFRFILRTLFTPIDFGPIWMKLSF